MMHFQSTPHTGFTLVETLVAISILTLAMVGPFSSIQNSINAAYVSRDTLIATSLAQEGVEYVRSVRDGNYLWNYQHPTSKVSWLASLDGTSGAVGSTDCRAPKVCVVDAYYNTISAPSPIPFLNLLTSSPYVYNHAVVSAGNVATRFKRTVQLVQTSGLAREYQVVVTVTWETQHTNYTTTYTEYLEDWQNTPS